MKDDTGAGWVHVREEPNHFHRYENNYVRVYDVRFEPGEKSLYHKHDEDTLYVAVYPTRVREQTWGQHKHTELDLPAGLSACRTHRSEPLIHVVENRGDGLMRMIGAEVKATPPVVSAEALEAPGHNLHPEQPGTPRLRLYLIELQPGESTGRMQYAFSGLTVFISAANLLIRDGAGPSRTVAGVAGDNIWHDGPLDLEILNTGPGVYKAVLGEWC